MRGWCGDWRELVNTVVKIRAHGGYYLFLHGYAQRHAHTEVVALKGLLQVVLGTVPLRVNGEFKRSRSAEAPHTFSSLA